MKIKTVFHGKVTKIVEAKTKKSGLMAFVYLKSKQREIYITFFPQQYQKFQNLLQTEEELTIKTSNINTDQYIGLDVKLG